MFDPEKNLINLNELKKKREKGFNQESVDPNKEMEKETEADKNKDGKTFEEEKAKQEKIDEEDLKKIREKFENPEKKKEIMEEYGEKRASTLKNVMDLGIKITPVVGEASMIADGLRGKNKITGEKLSGKERLFNVAVGTTGLALLFVPGAGEVGEAARTAMVLGKGVRIGKAMEKGIVAGRSVKGMERLAKVASESEKGKKFSSVFTKTSEFMKKNPELVKKAESGFDDWLKKYLTENNPARKKMGEIKTTRAGSLLEKTGITDDAKSFSIKDFTKEKVLSFFKSKKEKPETTPEESKENLEKRKVA